jgi:hypothetical protein
MTGLSVVALIGSPYQALSLLEYVKHTGATAGIVFVNQIREPTMVLPTFHTLRRLNGFAFRLRTQGGFAAPASNTGEVAAEIAAIAQSEAPGSTVVIGDYRETVGWRVARNLDCDRDRVVVIDDGVATMSIDRIDGGVAPLEWSAEAESGGFLPMPAVTFFTAFGRSLRVAPDDVVLENNWAYLKSIYRELRRSASLTLVIGQGYGRIGLIDAEPELKLALELVERARDLHPGTSPLYVAHRGESIEKLRAVAESCDVVRFDLPIELVPVDTGWLPAGIVGFNSTALTSFAEVVPPGLPIHAVRVPVEQFHFRREHIAEVYRRLEKDYADSITVID